MTSAQPIAGGNLQPLAFTRYGARSETSLDKFLPLESQPPVTLHRAMRYAVLGGGKRLRPVLVFATGVALGAPLNALDAAAAAVEIIHAYSLVHDDLPAMDDDALRRGRPTCHVAFGEATAILAGDALQALAFEVLAKAASPTLDSVTHVEILRTLADACGSHGMAGGQALDLAAVGKMLTPAELERMHVYKTGALIRASVRLGALCAGCVDPTLLTDLERYGHCVGLAFQIRDDLLDIEGDSAAIGKTAGKDVINAKPTYPAILGVRESYAQLNALVEEAIATVSVHGATMQELIDIARYVASRRS